MAEAQSIAEQVFTGMAAAPDAKPQVYYLLGYLRMEQGRWDEAVANFRRATEADPDYLNAWKKLAEALPNTAAGAAESDRVAFRLLELDPAGRRGDAGVREVRDLAALWRAFERVHEAGMAPPEKVFPLGDRAKKADGEQDRFAAMMRRQERPRTPAERLARHGVLEAVTRALDEAHAWRTESE